jgi:hypothetical protein
MFVVNEVVSDPNFLTADMENLDALQTQTSSRFLVSKEAKKQNNNKLNVGTHPQANAKRQLEKRCEASASASSLGMSSRANTEVYFSRSVFHPFTSTEFLDKRGV